MTSTLTVTSINSWIQAGADLVLHAAGPFQRAEKCTVLEAAISTKVSKRLYLLNNCRSEFYN
jgi:hypothetical protein